MAEFAPFNLASVIQNAEAIKGMRRQGVLDDLQAQYVQSQMGRAGAQEQRAVAQEGRVKTEFDQEQAMFGLRQLNAATAEISQNPSALKRWAPVLIAIDPNGGWDNTDGVTPEQIQAGAKKIYESSTAALRALSAQGQTNTVQSTHILDNGNIGIVRRDGTIQDTGQKAKPQMFYGEVAGVPTVTRATGAQTSTTPVSTLPAEAGAQQTLANARAAGAAEVIPAEARSAARDKLPRARAAFRRLGRVADAVEGLADNMLLQGGPFQASALSVTKEGQELDNAVAQLMPEITALTRVPGVGSQSDLEQRLANLALPSSANYPEVNRKAIEELDLFLKDLEAAYSNVAAGGGGQQNSEQAGGLPDFQNMSEEELRRLAGGQQ